MTSQDYTQGAAYRRGVARAAVERLKAPSDDGTVEVSVPTDWISDREYFRLCRTCGQRSDIGDCACLDGDGCLMLITLHVDVRTPWDAA